MRHLQVFLVDGFDGTSLALHPGTDLGVDVLLYVVGFTLSCVHLSLELSRGHAVEGGGKGGDTRRLGRRGIESEPHHGFAVALRRRRGLRPPN